MAVVEFNLHHDFVVHFFPKVQSLFDCLRVIDVNVFHHDDFGIMNDCFILAERRNEDNTNGALAWLQRKTDTH